MNKMKKVLGNFTVLSVFCIVMGIALIIRPDFFTRVVGLVVGGVITAMGAVALLRYFIRTKTIIRTIFGWMVWIPIQGSPTYRGRGRNKRSYNI